MRRAIGWVLILVGVVLALAGATVMALVGVDDVLGPGVRPAFGDSRVMVSSPQVLARHGGTLVVRAQNPQGRVFLGVAHPVDVRDLTKDVTTLTLREARARGLSVSLDQRRRAAPEADPTTIAMWSTRVSGAGEQRLEIPMSGAVQQLYVGPVGAGGPLRLDIGLKVAGAFTWSLAATIGGVVLTALGWVLVRSRRGPASSVPSADEGAPSDVGRSRSTPRASVTHRLFTLPVGLAVVAACLTGCSVQPEPATPWDPATVSKPAMTRAEAVQAMKEYDRLNNPAIAATSTSAHDPTAWEAVDTGPVLAGDRFLTALDKVRRSKPVNYTLTNHVDGVYASSITGYPAVAIVRGRRVPSRKADRPDAPYQALSVMVKRGVADRWRMWSALPVVTKGDPTRNVPEGAKGAPTPLAPGPASTVTAAQRATAAEVAHAYVGWFTSRKIAGGEPGILGAPGVRDDLDLTKREKDEKVTRTIQARLVTDDAPGLPGVVAVRVAGGMLVLADYAVTMTSASQAGVDGKVRWIDQAVATVRGQQGWRSSIVDRSTWPLAILVPDGGVPICLGATREAHL